MTTLISPNTNLVKPQSAPEAAKQQNWPELLTQLLDRQSLSVEQASVLMRGWLTEEIPPVISGAILAAIQSKGVSASELVGMVKVLRQQALKSNSPIDTVPMIDTCGTGGDGASTFNISTAVAFVAAAAGVKVAKHGNRSSSSKAGSADVLEALGLNLSASPERVEAAASEVGITFLYAPGWHPAFKAIMPLRKTLKIRTVFNLLGPLLNPMQPTGQVIGVYDSSLVETVALALTQLNIRRAVVVHGREGLDEVGLADLTDAAFVSKTPNGTIGEHTVNLTVISPTDSGIATVPTSALKGGDVNDNAEILKAVLQGKGTQAQQDVVALNAAMALYVGESVSYAESISKGVAIAKEVLASGQAWKKLEELSQFLQD
ncbi:anthranilate phosphoribosyltransferase [Lyngbya sp. PCC 8106]|uniref:anthranilate phosphoribosyltransferase n=1 Tax=Lyngbya sp. (strain PCC 8106) TaxID=313612 RepID=UPI0000EAD1CA|nr:anthranilate phosphoribosyltransferase [Lyngbya sp. PCC 8106]EAW38203.1 anthranilate phosphoribosyltransferase [Lyngbya sp. PCC 8106]